MSIGDHVAGIGTRGCILLAIGAALLAAADPNGPPISMMLAVLALLLLGANLALLRIERVLRRRLTLPPTMEAPAPRAMVSAPVTEEEREAMRANLAARGIRAPAD